MRRRRPPPDPRVRRRRCTGRTAAVRRSCADRARSPDRAFDGARSVLAVGDQHQREVGRASRGRASWSRCASSSRSRSNQRYGTWLRARNVLISWLRSDQRCPTTRTPVGVVEVRSRQSLSSSSMTGYRLLLGRVPRLEQVVVEADVVDRLDRHVGVGVRGEQDELGVGRLTCAPARGTRRRSSPAFAGPRRSAQPVGRAARTRVSTVERLRARRGRGRSGTRRRTGVRRSRAIACETAGSSSTVRIAGFATYRTLRELFGETRRIAWPGYSMCCQTSGCEPSTSVNPYSAASCAELTDCWFHRARSGSAASATTARPT